MNIGNAGTKFNIKTIKETTELTKLDKLLTFAEHNTPDTSHALRAFVIFEEYDSESVALDVELFAQYKKCNITLATNQITVETVHDCDRFLHVTSRTMSTGILFWYWPWYKELAEKEDEFSLSTDMQFKYVDLANYTMQQTYVSGHYDSLKAEVLATGFISPEMFQEKLIDEVKIKLDTEFCRKLTSFPMRGLCGIDPYHYDIEFRSPITANHIRAVILYCCFTVSQALKLF